MTLSIDPAERLPAEVFESVWACLPPKDLLSCRRVSLAWRDLLDHSRVWGRYLPGHTGSWLTYRRHAELSVAWVRAAFRLHTASRSRLASNKIAVGDNHIYILDGRIILQYDKLLEGGVEEWELEGVGVALAAGGDTVGVVMQDTAGKYQVEVRGRLKLRSAAVSGIVAVGPRGEVVLYQPRLRELSACSPGREERHSVPPGQLAALALSHRYYAALTLHPVSRGAGFSVHRLSRSSPGPWEEVYLAENRSPLATMTGSLTATERALVLSHHVFTEHSQDTRHMVLHDDGRRLTEAGQVALLPRDAEAIVAVSPDGSLHYSRHGRRRYTLRLGCLLSGARLATDYLLLWNADSLYTLTIRKLDGPDVDLPLDLEWIDGPA